MRFGLGMTIAALLMPLSAEAQQGSAGKPRPQRQAPASLTSGDFRVDPRDIADPRLPTPSEPARFGQGRIDDTMTWKLGRNRAPAETRTPDPFFNRGGQ